MARTDCELPSREQVAQERDRLKREGVFRRTLGSTVAVLVVVAAVAVLVSMLWLPVLQVYGSSMSPTIEDGQIVLMVKTPRFRTGDVVAFSYNNKILVKRVICGPGDWISIGAEGQVSVNGSLLSEPYITDQSLGECNLSFPYQVPDEAYFVMGDHRSVSVDSRNTLVGCIRTEQIIGRVVLRLWPLNQLEWIH